MIMYDVPVINLGTLINNVSSNIETILQTEKNRQFVVKNTLFVTIALVSVICWYRLCADYGQSHRRSFVSLVPVYTQTEIKS